MGAHKTEIRIDWSLFLCIAVNAKGTKCKFLSTIDVLLVLLTFPFLHLCENYKFLDHIFLFQCSPPVDSDVWQRSRGITNLEFVTSSQNNFYI